MVILDKPAAHKSEKTAQRLKQEGPVSAPASLQFGHEPD